MPAREAQRRRRYEHPQRRALVAALALASAARRSDAQFCQGGGPPEPLIWEVARGGTTQRAYVVAGHKYPQHEMGPLSPVISEAVTCADIAYFGTACTPGDGGLGSYYKHCNQYPLMDPKDSIAERLPPELLVKVQQAMVAMANGAPPECAPLAEDLKRMASFIANPSFMMTLRSVYLSAVQVLHKEFCTIEEDSPGGHDGDGSFSKMMRQQLTAEGHPIFGLLDVKANCQMLQSHSYQQDIRLANHMFQKFTNSDWRAEQMTQYESIREAIQCGDMEQLKSFAGPLHTRLLGQRNPEIVDRISYYLSIEPLKRHFMVINIPYLLDLNGTRPHKSVLTLLQEANFTVTRLPGTGRLGCPAGVHRAPGAKELDMCFLPPADSLDQTCQDFAHHMKDVLGADPMFGRNVSEGDCPECFDSENECECEFKWSNVTQFVEMCENTTINGVKGKVWTLDLIRNPGSTRTGKSLVTKTAIAPRMMCYAESCEIPLVQEMALRRWYKEEPGLNTGLVLFHPYEHEHCHGFFCGLNFLIMIGAVVAVCVVALICLFLRPKRQKQKRSMNLEYLYPAPVEPDLPPPPEKKKAIWPPPSTGRQNLMPFPVRELMPHEAPQAYATDGREDLQYPGTQGGNNMRYENYGMQEQAMQNGLMYPMPQANAAAMGMGMAMPPGGAMVPPGTGWAPPSHQYLPQTASPYYGGYGQQPMTQQMYMPSSAPTYYPVQQGYY